ncbi:hypothetical protein ACCO45_005773 [Purpureocillium lilacinum]|uniref:Uncharacterized protein n=1 Tax=Purpureocillium lilacinum TaxID=33203 RepID=A0ACC4DZ05_PURLI
MAATSEPACQCDCAAAGAGALPNETFIKLVICAGLALLLACITRPLQDGPSRFSHATWVSACFVATAALLWTASSTAEMQPPPFPHQQQQMQGVVADDDGGQLNLYLRRRKRLVVAATVTGVFMGFATAGFCAVTTTASNMACTSLRLEAALTLQFTISTDSAGQPRMSRSSTAVKASTPS